nr:hypothetical protein [Tanacetum cinerariifolium]
MVEQAKLKIDLLGKPVDHTDYRSMIGSLMYVTLSRPDIMFATCICARYQANPIEHHVSAVKRIFRYLKGTIDLGLWHPKDFGFDLTAYSDADHAGCHLDRKKSEYVVVSSYCAQVLWMRTQLTNYGFFYDKVFIYCDSKSTIAILCNLVQHTRTKHVDVREDLDEIEEVNANCILMANLQQASSSGTQSDSTPVYDTDRSAEVHENYNDNEIFNMFIQEEQYTKLLEPIPEPQQVPQNDNNVISKVTDVEQGGETVEQHSVNFEETRALY